MIKTFSDEQMVCLLTSNSPNLCNDLKINLENIIYGFGSDQLLKDLFGYLYNILYFPDNTLNKLLN